MVYERGSNFPARFRSGFLAEAERRGLRVGFVPSDEDAVSVARAFDDLVAAVPGMTAVVLNSNESVQTALLELLRHRGIRVPEDLSIISACSSFDTSHFNPPLDVIPLPADLSCTRAIELTMAQLAGDVDPHVELIEPSYVDLGSTALPT